MIKNCTNCGGEIVFSPKDKGNKCLSCGTVFPINYKYEFGKKPFENSAALAITEDDLAKTLKSIKCEKCGAIVLLSKNQMKSECPYCGNSAILEGKTKKLMYIDSIIPFSFGKAEAMKKFKTALRSRFYANKKIFKNIGVNDINGAYINAFVFDMETTSTYNGKFTYRYITKDENGNSKTMTGTKTVDGVFNKNFKNITIEVNSNIEQKELVQIFPFEYTSAVKFNEDFMNGYMLEYQDKMFNSCVEEAETFIKKEIERALLKKYNCDSIVDLDLSISYPSRKYNYCLLPVYFISRSIEEKSYKVVMNGQSGKVGKLPTDNLRIILSILLFAGIFTLLLVFIMFLITHM